MSICSQAAPRRELYLNHHYIVSKTVLFIRYQGLTVRMGFYLARWDVVVKASVSVVFQSRQYFWELSRWSSDFCRTFLDQPDNYDDHHRIIMMTIIIVQSWWLSWWLSPWWWPDFWRSISAACPLWPANRQDTIAHNVKIRPPASFIYRCSIVMRRIFFCYDKVIDDHELGG